MRERKGGRVNNVGKDIEPEILFVLTMDFSKPPVHAIGSAPHLLSNIYRQQAASALQCENLIQTGFISPAEVALLHSVCDLVVFPSILESFGFPMLEALAYGKPVVAADVPVNREGLKKNPNHEPERILIMGIATKQELINTQRFGIELEVISITRKAAAEAAQGFLGGTIEHQAWNRTYDPWVLTDSQGREWKFIADGS